MMRLLRNQGMESQYANEVIGFNARMTDIHAAIGRVQLTKVEGWTKVRQDNAAYLDAHLEGVVVPPVADTRRTSTTSTRSRSTAASVTASSPRMREEHQVGSGVYYPIPNHQLASLTRYAEGLELPVTQQVAPRGHLAAGPPLAHRGRPRAHRHRGQHHGPRRRLSAPPGRVPAGGRHCPRSARGRRA